MATLLNARLPSDDEEDQDFVPDEVDSDEEASKRKNTAKKAKRLRGVAAAQEDDGVEGAVGDELPAATAASERKRLEKKAKVDELWGKLNQRPAASSKAGSSVSLAALCKPASKARQPSGDDAWMRQLGLGPVKPEQAAGRVPADKRAVAAAALAAAKSAASINASQQYGIVTVTETRRFAGQNITVQREVQAGSKAAAKVSGGEPPLASDAQPTAGPSAAAAGDAESSAAAAAAAKKKAGLDAVLESLTQVKKVSVLDKTRSDWKEFKRGDEAVDEELEAHKRSGAGYLDKKAFLSRAELAEYERERDRRLGADVRNRGRL